MDMPSGNARARRALVWAFMVGLFASGLSAAPVGAADPAKTLRVVLTSAEMSFDPQFSADAGSDGQRRETIKPLTQRSFRGHPARGGIQIPWPRHAPSAIFSRCRFAPLC